MSFFRSTKPTNRPQPNFDSERAQNIAAQAMRHIMNEEEDSTSSGATHQPAKPKPVVPDFDDLLPGFEPVDGYTPKSKTFFSPSNGQTDLTGNPSVREPQGEMFADEDDEDENNVFIPKTNSNKEDTDDMAMSNMAVLSESTEIKGDINVKGDMRICGVVRGMVVSDGDIIVSGGEVDGDVKAKNITLEAGSVVKGNLHASGIAKLNGTVDGNVTAHDLKLCNGSILKSATIKAGTLSSEGNVTIESKALRIGAEDTTPADTPEEAPAAVKGTLIS